MMDRLATKSTVSEGASGGNRFQIASIDAEVTKLSDLKAHLEVSFLGNRLLYWIKGVTELPNAVKKAWASYSKTYQGPHCIVFFDESHAVVSSSEYLVVEIPESVSVFLYKQLAQFFYPTILLDSFFLHALFERQLKVSLDEACMILGYHRVVGRNSDAFFKDWCGKLLIPEKSLFTLSQYFFAQQPKSFFKLWKNCYNDYPDEFWIAYWSELMWQSSLFVMRAHNLGIAEAKKVSYRLPFSFINKDWQRYSVESLTSAHQFLYTLDYTLKHGEHSFGLELFFHKFLRGKVSSYSF
ncbi:hypothetical protein H0X06_01925 [Candidatus Dependentiae bacterium]|nr:hypothetical protein [Candidatus Dependentiae bacterium]